MAKSWILRAILVSHTQSPDRAGHPLFTEKALECPFGIQRSLQRVCVYCCKRAVGEVYNDDSHMNCCKALGTHDWQNPPNSSDPSRSLGITVHFVSNPCEASEIVSEWEPLRG
jgi:hypothetical protein